jgi:hypothetical protein
MMIRLVQLGGYGDSAFYVQQDMCLCFYVEDSYPLVWAEAKSDATSVIFDFTDYFIMFLQWNPWTDPIPIL